MLLGYPISEIALLALWIAGAGILVGILAGLFGIGGGAIIVPVLYEVFRVLEVPEAVRMQVCIGTSLAIIVPTTVRSYTAHKKKGAVIPQVVRIWALPALIGVATGSVIAHYAPAQLFKIVFVAFASFIAIRMLIGTARGNLGSELPGRPMLTLFWLPYRTCVFTRGCERGVCLQRRSDVLRTTDAAGGRNVFRRRGADHNRGDRRLYARGLAIYGANAAIITWFRVAHRVRIYGTSLELYGKLRRSARPLVAAAQA